MKVIINKSELKGSVDVPGSKSLTLRALMCAALAKGTSEIISPLDSEDTEAAVNVLEKIGVNIEKERGAWRVTGGSFRILSGELHCGESATTMRFMTAICSLIPGKHTLVGGPSLTKRPMRSLVEALGMLGVKAYTAGKTTPPVTIEGGTFKGGKTELPGNISSQFISALMLIAPFAQKEVKIKLTTPLTSRPYVRMTINCLKQFGINVRAELEEFVIRRQRYLPARITIEGDWSSASYFLALGAVSGGVTVNNISTASLQGDRVIINHLRAMGAIARVEGNSITISRGKLEHLRAINTDLSDCIDLLPTMAVIAALSNGKSVFTGIERARIKESNRVNAVKEGLEKLGIAVVEDRDRLTITGRYTPKKTEDGEEVKPPAEETIGAGQGPVLINSFGDHRIAMAFSVLGIALGNIAVDRAECVAKTFPDYWDKLKNIGGDIKTGE